VTENKNKTQVWGKRLTAPPDELNLRFCSGRDVTSLSMADAELFAYDIWTNLAHAKMLHQVGILNSQEIEELQSALNGLLSEYNRGNFQLDPAKEDVHINIEHYITFDCGVSAGKKLHTGRSRNDQVATDMRLYLREQAIALCTAVLNLIDSIHKQASNELNTVMPGFTHYQPAMITTVAHWLAGWSQGLLRDLESIYQNMQLLNRSPLGAAASFGTSWPIDREYTAELLGFSGVEDNSLDCISTRGENEARIASSVAILMNHLSTISQDIILLSTPHYDMLKIDDRFVTGSSIMPQKRNPDFAELVRSKSAVSHGILMSLLGIQKGAMSGYNRDSQQTKYLILDLMRECSDAPQILAVVIDSLEFNRDIMLDRCTEGFINATDIADRLAREYGLPFRECYDVISLAVKNSESLGHLTIDSLQQSVEELGMGIKISSDISGILDSPLSLIEKRQHTGAPSPASVTRTIEAQSKHQSDIQKRLQNVEEKMNKARAICFSA